MMADLESMLENWGRWCHESKARGHCASIESHWKSPQVWYEPGAPQSPPMPIDIVCALAINRAWRHVPEPYKAVLSDWYARRLNARFTCRRLAIAFRDHGYYLDRARTMIANRLTWEASKGKSRIQKTEPLDLPQLEGEVRLSEIG
jgi:hypothetical protein